MVAQGWQGQVGEPPLTGVTVKISHSRAEMLGLGLWS